MGLAKPLAVAVALLGCSCSGKQACQSGCDSPTVHTDGGPRVDAANGTNPTDSGRRIDASGVDSDVTSDSSDRSSDASNLDATSTPSGSYPFLKGEWLQLPGVPAECDIRVAVNPKDAIPPLDWQPCAQERKGCLRWSADWSPRLREAKLGIEGWQTAIVGGEPLFTVRRWSGDGIPDDPSYTTSVTLQRLDGTALFALEDVTRVTRGNMEKCRGAAGALGFNERGIAVYEMRDYNSPTESGKLLQSSWEAPAQFVETALSPSDLTGTPFNLTLVNDTLFTTVERRSGTSFYFTTVAYDLSKRQVHELKLRGLPAWSADPQPLPQGVLLEVSSPTIGLYYFGTDGSAKRLISPQAGYVTTLPVLDLQDRTRVVWAEIDSALNAPPDGPGALWEGKVTASGDIVSPRKVVSWSKGEIDPGNGLAVNGGYAVAMNSFHVARLIRLSDGYIWNVPSEPDRYMVTSMWVDDKYVWYVTGSGQNPRMPITDGFIRIERVTLGEPLPPQEAFAARPNNYGR